MLSQSRSSCWENFFFFGRGSISVSYHIVVSRAQPQNWIQLETAPDEQQIHQHGNSVQYFQVLTSKQARLLFSYNVKQVIREEQWSTMVLVLIRAAVWAAVVILQIFVPNEASLYSQKVFLLQSVNNSKQQSNHTHTNHCSPTSTVYPCCLNQTQYLIS